ncbi:MAG: hypothetical protein OEV93_03255 [Candidatus Moranbacteria bacterium]|nr:hypothetical protein [Candidatus Moranbacteria bacterium]
MNKKIKTEVALGIIVLLAVIIGGALWLSKDKIGTVSQNKNEKTNNIAEKNIEPAEGTYNKFVYSTFKRDNFTWTTNESFGYADLRGNKTEITKIKHHGDATDYDVARNNGRIAYKIDGDSLTKAELWSAGIGLQQKKLATITDRAKGDQIAWGPIIDDDGNKIAYTITNHTTDKNEVWTIAFDGKNKKLIKTLGADGNYGCNLYDQFFTPEFFSADGKTIYIESLGQAYKLSTDATGADWALASTKAEKCVLSLDLETGNLKKLNIPVFADKVISISNDKSKVVVQLAKKDWFQESYNGIGVLDLTTGKFEKIFQSDNLTDFFGARFSDDDKKIAYSAKENDSKTESLYVYDLVSKTNREITKSSDEVFVKFYIGNKIIYSEKPYSGILKEVNDDGSNKKDFSFMSLDKDESVDILEHLIK